MMNNKQQSMKQLTKVFSVEKRSKILTYIWAFLCPPYAFYRLNRIESQFNRTEKIALQFVMIVYMITLLMELVKGS